MHDVTQNRDANRLAGCTIYRFDAPLIFANARTFRDDIVQIATLDKSSWIIIAAEPITDVDTTACDMLEDLVTKLDEMSIRLVFAELKTAPRRKLDQFGLEHVIGDDRYFPTISSAVDAHRALTGAQWQPPDSP